MPEKEQDKEKALPKKEEQPMKEGKPAETPKKVKKASVEGFRGCSK